MAGGVTAVRPGTDRAAAASWAPLPSRPMITTGWPPPPGKCCSSTVCPITESGWPRNDWALVRPLAFSPVRPRAIAPSTSAVVTQTIRGRGAMPLPTRAHSPREVGSAEPKAGRTGQNTHRPVITSRAGSSVIIASRATATPMASTGPMPLVEFSSATVRASRLTMTVPPLATTAGPARRSATAIASCRSSWRRSSSRYRAVSSSA